MNKLEKFAKFMVRGTTSSSDRIGSENDENRITSGMGGDGVVKAFEVVITPVVFALIGVFIDYKVHTAPVFTLGFLFFGIAGMVIKLWYGTFTGGISSQFLHNGESSARVIRRSQIKPVCRGELLGGDLHVPSDLDLSLDNGVGFKHKSDTDGNRLIER